MDDAAAARACLTGNVDAFRHFVERYQSRALAHARLLTRNDADAADAAQDAFLDAFRNLRAFDPARQFYAWFYVLLRNRCFKQRSRRGTRAESGSSSSPAVSPGLSEVQLDLWRAIGRLSHDDAELIVLKHIEGWTYEELSRDSAFVLGQRYTLATLALVLALLSFLNLAGLEKAVLALVLGLRALGRLLGRRSNSVVAGRGWVSHSQPPTWCCSQR